MTTSVWVPSRGRAGKSPTIQALRNEGIDHFVVVGEEEQDDYVQAYPGEDFLFVKEKGIGKVRRCILNAAREIGDEWIWMIDDDITGVGHRAAFLDRYNDRPFWEVMPHIQDLATSYPSVGAAAPMARQFGWSQEAAMWNKRVGYMVLLNTTGPWNYWPFLHEDTDLTLQILTRGWRTLLLPQFIYETGPMGGREGGCYDDYQRGAGVAGGLVLQGKWEATHPGLVRITTNRAGATVTRIDWRRFYAEPF